MKRLRKEPWQRGPLAWMTYNRVTPNLLMIALLLGGFLVSGKIKKEVFPDFELDRVSVSVAYPGSSPEEVEQGIVLVVEDPSPERLAGGSDREAEERQQDEERSTGHFPIRAPPAPPRRRGPQ